MGKQSRGGVLVGLVLAVAGGCMGDPSPTHLGTDVVSGETARYASVTVGTDGTTYFGDGFTGPLDIDPLGAGDARMAADAGPTTLVWRTRADGTRDWIGTVDGYDYSTISTSWTAGDGAVFVAALTSVTKLDSGGQQVWTSPCTGWGCDGVFDVASAAATADGGIVVLGWDKRLVRLAGDGSVSWVSTAARLGPGCVDFQQPVKVLEAPDGTMLIGGNTVAPCTGASSSWPLGMFILRLDAGGNLVASRTVENGDGNAEAVLVDMAVGADGSVFASVDIQGTVDFDDGPGKVVRSAGSGTAGFAMKMRPDFSLIAAFKTAANQNFLGLIAPMSDGGLVGVVHHAHDLFGKGSVSDPYLVRLDPNLQLKSSLRLAGRHSYVNGLAVGGDVIAVVGMGPANEYIPGASAETVPNGLFLARYRF
jgi:hypothetical protein